MFAGEPSETGDRCVVGCVDGNCDMPEDQTRDGAPLGAVTACGVEDPITRGTDSKEMGGGSEPKPEEGGRESIKQEKRSYTGKRS